MIYKHALSSVEDNRVFKMRLEGKTIFCAFSLLVSQHALSLTCAFPDLRDLVPGSESEQERVAELRRCVDRSESEEDEKRCVQEFDHQTQRLIFRYNLQDSFEHSDQVFMGEVLSVKKPDAVELTSPTKEELLEWSDEDRARYVREQAVSYAWYQEVGKYQQLLELRPMKRWKGVSSAGKVVLTWIDTPTVNTATWTVGEKYIFLAYRDQQGALVSQGGCRIGAIGLNKVEEATQLLDEFAAGE